MSGSAHAVVKTNSVPDSVCKLDIEPVTFKMLWDNYVIGDPYKDVKTGKVPPGFGNQCAIRLSATLHKVGVEMKSFTRANVSVKPREVFGRILLDGKNTAVKADQLGSWLSRQPFCGLPRKPEEITGQEWASKIKGRTGIVMFDAYWARQGETVERASGGHIDLRNGARVTNNGVVGFLETFSRFKLGIHRPWIPVYSDLGQSKLILFFEIK